MPLTATPETWGCLDDQADDRAVSEPAIGTVGGSFLDAPVDGVRRIGTTLRACDPVSLCRVRPRVDNATPNPTRPRGARCRVRRRPVGTRGLPPHLSRLSRRAHAGHRGPRSRASPARSPRLLNPCPSPSSRSRSLGRCPSHGPLRFTWPTPCDTHDRDRDPHARGAASTPFHPPRIPTPQPYPPPSSVALSGSMPIGTQRGTGSVQSSFRSPPRRHAA